MYEKKNTVMAFWVKQPKKIEKELYVRVLSGMFLAPMR